MLMLPQTSIGNINFLNKGKVFGLIFLISGDREAPAGQLGRSGVLGCPGKLSCVRKLHSFFSSVGKERGIVVRDHGFLQIFQSLSELSILFEQT